MDPLISVIIPVYKVEPYLRECVDSVLAQTYQNLEIILVDDGSPDNCPAICDEYAEKDARVKVIHKENGGLSDARNVGMAVAKGEYISFADSDDLLPIWAIQSLFAAIKATGAQMSIGQHVRFDDGELPLLEEKYDTEVQMLLPKEAMKNMLRHGCASWARLYCREIHKRFLFPIGEINEDEAIVLPLLGACDRIAVTQDLVYCYRCREASITTSAFSKKKLDWIRHCRNNFDYIRQHYPELEADAAYRYRGSILWAMREILLAKEAYREKYGDLKKELTKEAALFARIPFASYKQKFYYVIFLRFPFFLNRAAVRIKERLK